MIEYKDGSIFDSPCEVLVNPVNCEGVMGKGLALEFQSRFPDNFKDYKIKCALKELRPGKLHTHKGLFSLKRIINFPTKDKWRDPSKLEYITAGLTTLLPLCHELSIKSIAIPALGCGLGGLPWPVVKSLIEETFKDSELLVEVYPPK